MPQRTDTLSRAQLIGGMLGTGALAACAGGGVNTTPVSPAPVCAAPSTSASAISQIFSNSAFNGLDKTTIAATFDHSSTIAALGQGYRTQSGQQIQTTSVIRSIPSAGIVIQTPGTYTLGNNILWTPNAVQCSAITIQCSNVTLNLAGFTLTASISDKSQQIAGIQVAGPSANTLNNISITDGTIANVPEYGILATGVCGLNISRITVTGVCLQNLAIRLLTPAGIQVTSCETVTISDCSVTQMNVTTDSSAGIMMLQSAGGTITNCNVNGMVNNDGAIQAFSLIACINVTTTGCVAQNLQSHFNGNILTSGHTVLGFCPIFCLNLSYVNNSASNLTGCCDDCHGMSVFLDAQVTVSGFHADNVIDGVAASNSGAKATGLEVFGIGVSVTDSTVSNIKAINPQDKQSTGFSAWGVGISFTRCVASNISVVADLEPGSHGTGFGWAPDPRAFFAFFGALFVTYTDCSADHCDVAFDTWYHVNSTWVRPVFTNSTVGFLVEPGGMRTLTANACSECEPPISTAITNIATGNTFPPQ